MKNVVISLLGTVLDKRGKHQNRWDKWRPTIGLCQQDKLPISRLELLYDPRSQGLVDQVKADIHEVSPSTEVVLHPIRFDDPWDFENVYAQLLDFSRAYRFARQSENYLIHITTGTHVAQICLYLLTEAGYLPGKLLQTSPGRSGSADRQKGTHQTIDLDLSKYDQIASRFHKEHKEGTTYLKGGIQTNNAAFNAMIEQLEQVSIRSTAPILLTGPSGAGKSQLAKRIYALRKQKGLISGKLVTVNCATLRGDNAMASLFGHKKGAFTGANHERSGLLMEADQGLLFLDEIGELGLDEQAMLLSAIEEKRFLPLGADTSTGSDFQLIAGTNRDLHQLAQEGSFRADLLARIDLWSYRLPSLAERLEDFEANLDYELENFAAQHNKSNSQPSFNRAAKRQYLDFAQSPQALWSANFRDLNASVMRMATLADGGRIGEHQVRDEIARLKQKWIKQKKQAQQELPDNSIPGAELLAQLLPQQQIAKLDLFDRMQLANVIKLCQQADSMAAAGRLLFDQSRQRRASQNDSHRLKQYLDKFGLSFKQIKGNLSDKNNHEKNAFKKAF